MKYEVLERATLTVEKGSIVEVSERQYEVARRFLKPIKKEKPKEESPAEDSPAEDVPKKEKPKKSKK